MYLLEEYDAFGDFLRALLETERVDYLSEYINERLVSSIDGEATRELMTN